MKFLFQFFLASCLLFAGAANDAQALTPLKVIVFPGGFNFPIWVAQEKGFFSANGVAVEITPTPSSSFQLASLIDGKFDIAMTAFDNLVAYREGQGEVVDKVGPDLVAIMGADRGFLKLVTAPNVKTIPDLRGKTLSVDARNTGYAAVLFEILARAGLQEPDYSIATDGGVLQRYKDLLAGKRDGTMLISPFELKPMAEGFNVLGEASEMFGAYQGLVAGVRQSWAQTRRADVEYYIRAYVQAVRWLYDAANRDEALDIFKKYMQDTTDTMAEASYRILLDPVTGIQKDAAIDTNGMREVVDLRNKWGMPKRTLGDATKYYDSSFYEAAIKTLP